MLPISTFCMRFKCVKPSTTILSLFQVHLFVFLPKSGSRLRSRVQWRELVVMNEYLNMACFIWINGWENSTMQKFCPNPKMTMISLTCVKHYRFIIFRHLLQVVLGFVGEGNLSFEDKIAGLRTSVEIYGNVRTRFPATHERADALGHEIFMWVIHLFQQEPVYNLRIYFNLSLLTNYFNMSLQTSNWKMNLHGWIWTCLDSFFHK